MSDQTLGAGAAPAKKRSPLVLIMLGVIVLLLGGGGGAAYYFLMVKPKQMAAAAAHVAESPLPFTLAIKPFVISLTSSDGGSHFIQLGANLQLPSSSAGDVVTSVLPQLQDTMRQAMLSFKSEDLQTADGINKMRAAMIVAVNEALTHLLGDARIVQYAGDVKTGLVQNIFFPTLVIE
jgi:flagellar protein FliL